MKTRFRKICVAVACAVSSVAFAQVKEYTPVTDARLISPESSNWLLYRGNYDGWGYSSLNQINTGNVSKLSLAWSFSTGTKEGHEAPPIVNNGYMYVSTPGDQVIALDAKTGNELWRYEPQLPPDLMQLHPTNRGVALYGDNLYIATVDCKLIALDAKTGKVLWTKPVEDWKHGYYMTLAPLAAKGKIMVGASGGETGVRGFVAAYDAKTGKEEWRTYTVPGPKDPGGDTWPAGDAYKTGGGSIWITGTYDPKTNIAFWGTGNPAPWTASSRKGDNLYTDSTIAIDVDTGKIKGYHQYQHNDSWDWDEVDAPLLINTDVKGHEVKAAVHVGRDGYIWVLNRAGGKLNFVDAWPFAYNNVITSVDPKTGRVKYDETRKPDIGKGASFCPGLWGAKDWPPAAYNQKTKLLYVPANNHLCGELPAGEKTKYKPGEVFIGYDLGGVLNSIRVPKETQTIGELQAWNLKTGKMEWVHKFNKVLWAPLLTTAGDLIFAGGTNDRYFRAFDAKNGKILWKYPASSGVVGVPITYEVDGEQYVAVQSGWGVDAQRVQSALNQLTPDHQVNVPQGGTVLVFKLEK